MKHTETAKTRRSKMPQRPCVRRSFTLIELLVTITIISLLAAITAPALRDAMNRAKNIKCVSNMRQIHLAIMLYVNDHSGYYPILDPNGFNNAAFQWRQIELFSNSISTPEVYRCPFRNSSNGLPGEYIYSGTFNGKPAWTEYKLGDDNYQLMTNNYPWGRQLRPNMVVTIIDNLDWLPRHNYDNSANLCFGDGHIQMMTRIDYGLPGPEPGRSAPTGWFRWGLYDF